MIGSQFNRQLLVITLVAFPGLPQAYSQAAPSAPESSPQFSVGAVTVTPCTGNPSSPYESVTYTWDPKGQLTIRHENAYLNCCLKGVSVRVIQSSENLHLDELEIISPEGGLCGCSCYYTIEYSITGIHPGVYTFSFNQHPLYKLLPQLYGKADLRQHNRGVFQVERFKPTKPGVQ